MPLIMLREDITRMKVDAIVNTTNTALRPSAAGVSGAVFKAAGRERLEEACRELAPCPLGGAVITPGFALPCRYIIHTVTPVWVDGHYREQELLRACYVSIFALAEKHQLHSLAVPLIGGGSHGFDKRLALEIAISEIQRYLMDTVLEIDVFLTLFGRRSFALSKKLSHEVKEYITDHYIQERPDRRRVLEEIDLAPTLAQGKSGRMAGISPRLPFMDAVLKLIDNEGLTDPVVYKKANLTHTHFHKLKMKQINPSKKAAIALCLALRLDLEDSKTLLAHAGFALTRSDPYDLVVVKCIKEKEYNVVIVEALADEAIEGLNNI
ncbi:MAG: macro domain-containing protein [Eubacteriales bacterium]|nr:macro domain-containing protein [Eubacteriales bacterium]